MNDRTTIHRIGKNIRNPSVPAIEVLIHLVLVETARDISGPLYASRFLPIIRIRKIATMFARMMAITPPALPIPTSNCSKDDT